MAARSFFYSSSSNVLAIFVMLMALMIMVELQPSGVVAVESATAAAHAHQTKQYNQGEVMEGLAEDMKIDCGSKCAYRCSKASRQKICLRACGTCCSRCNCVPPGTSGNTEVCPCYANMTTHEGKLKCP